MTNLEKFKETLTVDTVVQMISRLPCDCCPFESSCNKEIPAVMESCEDFVRRLLIQEAVPSED